MTEGHKLYVTAHYGFDYSGSHLDNLMAFDFIEQFFEHRNGLKGFISDEKGDYIEEGSEVDLLMDELYESFDNKDVPKLVKECLHRFEMYEVLAEYNKPLCNEALKFKEELESELV